MPQLIDITGQVFGYLTVIKHKGTKNNSSRWLCKCKCGTKVIISGSDLRKGRQNVCSMRCKLREQFYGYRPKAERWLYITWRNMLRRCYNEADEAYHNYGARGIKVYKAWHKYKVFRKYILESLGTRPKGKDLDRINNNRGYVPGNIRWLSRRKNTGNKRTNLYAKYKGKVISLAHFYALKPRVVSYTVFRDRYTLGWKSKLAVTIPTGHRWPKNYTKHLREG